MLTLSSSALAADNLIANGDFERLNAKGFPVDWDLYKMTDAQGVEMVNIPERKGKRVVRVWTKKSPKATCGVRTRHIPVKPKGRYRFSFSAKLQDVALNSGATGHALGQVIFYDADKKHILRRVPMSLVGSRDWLVYKVEVDAPANAAFAMIKLQLLRASGQLWLDDVRFAEVPLADGKSSLLTAAQAAKGGTTIIPTPQYQKDLKGNLTIGKTCTISSAASLTKIPLGELERVLKDFGIKSTQATTRKPMILLTDRTPASIAKLLPAEYANAAKREEGYVLFCSPKAKQITIAAHTPAGAFYAIQTLRQLITSTPEGLDIPAILVADYPGLKRRGIAQGVRWFEHWEKNRGNGTTSLDRMAQLKLNEVLSVGYFMNRAFFSYCRTPMTAAQVRQLRNLVEDCRKRYITLTLSFRPTTPSGFAKNISKRDPSKEFDYLNEGHFAKLFAKMDQAYDVGVRSFNLVFADLRSNNQDVLHDPRHIKRFGNIGEAHAYLTKRCYDHLKAKDKSIRLQMIPLHYTDPLRGGAPFDEYLTCLRKLPADIELMPTEASRESCEYFTKLTGHTPFIWSNYLARFRKSKTALKPAFDHGGQDIADYVQGYVFLPNSPKNEGYKGLSWMTAADYLWNPKAYRPQESLVRVIRKHMPAELLSALVGLGELKEKMFLKQAMPRYAVFGNTKKERIAYCQTFIAQLDAFSKALKPLAPSRVRTSLLEECETYRAGWQNILKVTQQRPFPISVPKYAPANDGDEEALRANSTLIDQLCVRGGKAMSERPKVATRFYFSHDRRNLYITAFCDEPQMKELKTAATKHDGKVYLDDCVEFFIGTDLKDVLSYYQVSVNSAGVILDVAKGPTGGVSGTSGKRIYGKGWNGKGVRATTGKGPNQWWASVRIPLASLGLKRAKAGTRLRFEVARERYAGGGRELSHYAYPKGFNTPERFEILELAGPR
jgi:beta-N-acetylglucosaminidase/Glycosyl hydrolase family 20, domain 2